METVWDFFLLGEPGRLSEMKVELSQQPFPPKNVNLHIVE
jgi:hypothetical protein